VVAPFPLHPEGSAAARCLIGLMRGLALHGVDVRALTSAARGRSLPPSPADLDVERAYVEYPGTWRARLDRVVAPHSAFTRGAFGQRLAELSSESDVVHVHGIGAGAMIPKIGGRALVQLDCVTRRDRDVGRLWTREGRISLETLRAERLTLHRARWILASSVPVCEELASSAPGALVTYAPLPLDPSQYPKRADLCRPVAGLIGTARWPPTANSVDRLLTRVWPLVLRERPDAELLLAGRGMERASFPHLPSPSGVRWLGEVGSAKAFLQSLGLLLYPLERGSGAKVKVLESMLMGIPVVTTPEGAEGLAGDGGLIVEREDEALARAACHLLGDLRIRRQLGAEGHARFDAHHAPAVAASHVMNVYERIVAGAAR
jgi:glycosyltransferase involved in cell wall biosynthesis